MPTAKKVEAVQDLTDRLSRASIVLAASFQGLTVAQITQLRRRLREKGIEFKVVKNTLAGIAIGQSNKKGLQELLEGPTGLVFGYADQIEAAKTLIEYVRSARINMTVRGALVDSQLLRTAALSELVTLPPREVLAGRVLGQLASPFYSLLYVLQANLSGLLTVLQRHSEQLSQSNATN